MYGYIYKTTNLINNKIYIGQHKSQTFNESYIGSGKMLRDAVRKYGKPNFKNELIEWCETKEEADDKERFYIKQYGLPNPAIGYNITKGGQSRFFTDMKHSESSRARMSQRAKDRAHTGTSNGYLWYNNGVENKSIPPTKVEEYESKGWVRGRLFKEGHKVWNKGLTVQTDERIKKQNDAKIAKIRSGQPYGCCGIRGKDHYRYNPEKN